MLFVVLGTFFSVNKNSFPDTYNALYCENEDNLGCVMCPIEDSRGGIDGGALDVSIVSIAVWLAVRYMTPCVCMCYRKPTIVEFIACQIFIRVLF